MSRDEHGMPLPSFRVPVKRDEHEPHKIRDVDLEVIVYVNCADDQAYIEHALNHFDSCRDIVRRLAEPDNLSLSEMEAVIRDATILWSKMLKGAGDE